MVLGMVTPAFMALSTSDVCILLMATFIISPVQSQSTPAPALSTDPAYYYNLCAPSTCSNLTLTYPFALPTPCHLPSLQTLCPNNEHLLLTNPISTDTFRVLSINSTDPSTTALLIASDNLFTCGTQLSHPSYSNYETAFGLPLTYTVGTHYNCSVPIPDNSIQGLQNAPCIGCDGQDPTNVCYYAPQLATTGPPNCEIYTMLTRGGPFNASSVKNLRGLLQSGLEIRYSKPIECRGCEASGGRCGTKPESESFVCFCPSTVHRTNCTDGMIEDLSTWVKGPRRKRTPSKLVVVGIATSSVFIAAVVVAFLVIIFRRRKHNFPFNKQTVSSISPRRYSYSQLKKFTDNFTSKLGEGGFGSVYKGTIHSGGVEIHVAIKLIKRSTQTKKQFMNEVATIGSIHHHNLVSMLGYCVEGDTHALVYQFMENGSLDKYIQNITTRETDGDVRGSNTRGRRLSFRQMHSIALETARGILYLHEGCNKKILHCDIKPPNVLLDSNFSAKVSDFGLARMTDKGHSHFSLTQAQGTPGYAAPEMWLKSRGPVTEKSDVYGYGMLLLEMVGGRKTYDVEASGSSRAYFPEWLYEKIGKEEFPLLIRKMDGVDRFETIQGEGIEAEDVMGVRMMCLVGLWCIQHIPSNRPSMSTVIQMLEGHVEIPMPPHPLP